MEKKQLDLSAPLLSVRRLSLALADYDVVNAKTISKAPSNRRHSLPGYDLVEVGKPGAVPFLWEQTPGKVKAEYEVKPRLPKELSHTTRLPTGRKLGINRSVWGENSCDLIASEDGINENVKSDLASGDDECSDCFGTLSRTESLSLKCSISSCSSSSDCSDVDSSGKFFADPQTRDLMMRRFLPSAKAVTLEISQSSPRNLSDEIQHPLHVKNSLGWERKPLFRQYGSTTSSHNYQYSVDTESEDRKEESRNTSKPSNASFAILPRLLRKHSEPIDKMGSRKRDPLPSADGFRRPPRATYSGPLVKHSSDGSQRKFHSGVLSQKYIPLGEPNLSSHRNDKKKLEVSSPSWNSRRGCISPYRNEASPSPFRDGAGFLGFPKELDNLEAKNHAIPPPSESSEQASVPVSVAAERRSYVDSIISVQNITSNSRSPRHDVLQNSSDGKFDTFAEENSTFRSSVQVEGWQMRQPEAEAELSDDSLLFNGRISSQGAKTGRLQGSLSDKKLDQELEYPKLNLNRRSNVKNANADHKASSFPSPQPPPLPKSPSEPWLSRAISSIHLRNPFLHSSQGRHSKKESKKMLRADTKWETIVKASNKHRDHVRYSEELIRRGSEHLSS